MNRRFFLQSIPLVSLLPRLLGQEKTSETGTAIDPNERICAEKFAQAASSHLSEKPINEVVAEMGKSFLGTEYASTDAT